VTREIINKASKLKVIGKAGAGVDNIDVTKLVATDCSRQRTGTTSEAVAEHTMAYFCHSFVIFRSIPCFIGRKVGKIILHRIELHGKTIGVIGFGHIGTESPNWELRLGCMFL